METSKLIPAPIDGKNIMTDWIEEIFDGQCAATNGKTFLGFVNGTPVKCDIIFGSAWWVIILSGGLFPEREEVITTMNELRRRLKEKDKADEEGRTIVRYTPSGLNLLIQSFYWNE